MRVAISYGSADAASGGRLRDSLERRMARDTVTDGAGGERVDVLVALVSPSTNLGHDTADAGRVRRALERAVRERAGIVLVTLEGAAVPAPADLPPPLAPIGDLDPIRASNEYWDATVDSVVARIEQVAPGGRSGRRGWLTRLADAALHASRRVKIGATVGVVGGILGILVTLGIIDPGPDPEQRGTVEVSANAANAVTFEDFLELFDPTDDVPKPVPDDTEGYVYDLTVRLDDPENDRYALRWTARVADGGKPIAGRRDLLGARFDAARATGVHRVWVPCPPPEFDAVAYVVEFVLVDESQRSEPALDRVDGPRGECLFVEP